jgi:hypothetical protein
LEKKSRKQQSNLEIRLELYRTSVDPEKNIYLIDNFAKYAHQTNAKKHQYIKILEFENAQIMQDDWFITHGDQLYSDLCWQSKVVPSVIANSELGNVKTIHSPEVTHDQPVFFVGGANNYYHWILDYLPRLQVLKENPRSVIRRSFYGNRFYGDVCVEYPKDVKVYGNESIRPTTGPYVSTAYKSFSNSIVGEYIRHKFQNKSRYEA